MVHVCLAIIIMTDQKSYLNFFYSIVKEFMNIKLNFVIITKFILSILSYSHLIINLFALY